jgi:transcriptional regulator with XRE-family HTH domain
MTDSDKPMRSVTGMPPAAIRLEFAKNLQNALNGKGWNQSELARRMAPYLKSSRIGRDNISKYLRAKVLPLPHVLEAMAKVLEMESRDLLSSRATRATAEEHTPIHLRDLGDDRAWLEIHISQELPWSTALKVIGLLRGDERPLQA